MFCAQPFTCLDVLHRHYTPCCVAWLDKAAQVIRLDWDVPWRVWNHPNLVRLRAAILSGSTRFCGLCPRLCNADGTLEDRRHSCYQPVMERGPEFLNLGNDPSCNLHCWSCRSAPTNVRDLSFRETVMQAFLDAFLPTARRLSLSHSGDPFASPLYLPLMQSLDGSACPRLAVHLFTNGLLLPTHWDSIAGIHENINAISISVDAATKDTYETVRRGAKWRDLLAALAFVGDLRSGGKIGRFQLNFCVRATNFREMSAFVALAKTYSVDAVHFGMLRRWWQSEQAYAAENVLDPANPSHEEFVRLLDSEPLQDPIVGVGVFRPAVHAVVRDHERMR